MLSQFRPVRMVITNVRKDGSSFLNCLSDRSQHHKQLQADQQICTYYIGLQYEWIKSNQDNHLMLLNHDLAALEDLVILLMSLFL
jgi:hypothetical protein